MTISSHTIEETITGTIGRGQLLELLKQNKLIPESWDYCSIHVTQDSATDDINFKSKRTTAGPGK